MPKWTPLPVEKFYHQPSQLAFLQAKNERTCFSCKLPYVAHPPVITCPICGGFGKRRFDRLTIIAGRRFGKSRIGSIAGVEESTIPNTIGWACAPTVPKLHRYVIPAFQQLIPAEWVKSWNAEFLDLRLKNGSLIHFQTLEDPDQGRGQGLDWLWIDEVCELTKAHWEVLRPSLAGDTVAFFTTTPRGFDFVYDELYKPAENGVPGYWACHTKTSESANPDISQEFLAREKAQMSDEMYRQEYEADFVVFQGAVYGSAMADSQILRSDEDIRKIIPEWPTIGSNRQILVGIDTGADHPFGATKIIITEEGAVVCGEYLERHKSFIEHASALKAMAYSHGFGPCRWGINKNDRQRLIELAQHGIFCERAQNDIIAGTERVKSWLHTKRLFFIEKLVPNTIRQMKSYRWAENYSPKDEQKKVKEKVYKKEDELPDAIRYSLMCWPQLPKPAPANPARDISKLPGEMQATIERMRRIDRDPEPTPKDSPIGDFYL
jgi:hypothetical protein